MSRIARTAIGLMFVTMIAKILGFARELVLASAYGTSSYSDAYLAALNIPNVIFSIIGIGLTTTFIPIYYEIINDFGEKEGLKFTNNVFNIVTIICIAISTIGIICAEDLVRAFALGFEGETFELTLNFTRIFMLGLIFIGVNNIMTSYLQIKGNFLIPGLITVPCNIIVITSILLSTKYGLNIMGYGTLIGTIGQFLFLIPFAYKHEYRFKFFLNLKDKYIKKMLFLVGPVLIGVAVNQINVMVDKTIASTLVEGSISALNYSNRLNLFVTGLFITSISSVIYPMLSKLYCEDNKDKFIDSVVKSINSIVLLVIPISIGAIVLANPIVEILFKRGAFDERATQMTSTALVFYSIGMIGFGLREILGKIFYSLKDTKTPMINGSVSMIMNIALNIFLVKFMGYSGLAFATSISGIICTMLLFRSLKKKIGYFGQKIIIEVAFKSILASFIMGVITYVTHQLLSNMLIEGFIYDAISLLTSISIGFLVYIMLVFLFKIKEVRVLLELLRKKLKKIA